MSSELIWPTTPRNMIYTIDNLVYGNGVYVARQSSTSTILYSLDNITWQVAFTYNIFINKIVHLNNLFIVIGQPLNYTTSMGAVTPSNLIITSSDGINWTYRSSPAIFRLLAAAYGNNTFVIVGITNGTNYSLSSTDGFTWTLRYGAANNPWSGVAFGNGIFVAITETGTWGAGEWFKTMVSTNGISWTLSGISSNIMYNQWHSIIYANNRFVAIGKQISPASNGIMFSEDGWHWYSANNIFMNNQNYWTSVVYDGYYVYICSSNNRLDIGNIETRSKIFRSRITNNTPVWTEINNYPKNLSKTFSFIEHLNGQFFIMGPNNYLAVSLSTLSTPVFSNFNDINKFVGEPDFTITNPTSNSNGAFTYTSLNTAVATISGSTVTIIGAGITTITATQIATTNYIEASITCSLTVNTIIKTNPTISGFDISEKTFGIGTFSLTPPTSNSSGVFTYSSLNTDVVTISGTTATVVGVGSTEITATQAGTFNYFSGSISTILTVIKGIPIFTGFTNITKIFGDSSFPLPSLLSSSPGVITYSSENTDVATISGSTVTVLKVGSTLITATQASTPNYELGTTSLILTIGKAIPTISGFTDFTKTFGDTFFNLIEPISNSTAKFSFSSSNPAVASISGSTVTIIGAGFTDITATQPATDNYEVGTKSLKLTVSRRKPILSGFINLTKTFGDSSFSLDTPTSVSSGLFIFTSSTLLAATISGNTVSIVGAGSAEITATQEETANYESEKIKIILTINRKPPKLSEFINLNKLFGTSQFELKAPKSDSSGPITYFSTDTTVATIFGNLVTPLETGKTIIIATQEATSNFSLGIITCELKIDKKTPTLTGFNTLIKIIGNTFIIDPPESDSPGAFSYVSSVPSVASISGNNINPIKVGVTIITATQESTSVYTSKNIQCILQVTSRLTTVLSNFTNITQPFGILPLVLNPPTSNRIGSFIYVSSNPAVATILDNIVTIVGSGTTKISATQSETSIYTSATIGLTLTIIPIEPILNNFNDIVMVCGDPNFSLSEVTSTNPNPITFTSSKPLIATIFGNSITPVGGGTTNITASQLGTSIYKPLLKKIILTVNKQNTDLSNFNNFAATFGDNPLVLTNPISNNSTGAFSFKSLNTLFASISKDMVTLKPAVIFRTAGTVTITAKQAATSTHTSATISCELIVTRKTTALSIFNNIPKKMGSAPFQIRKPYSTSRGVVFTYEIANPDPGVATIVGTTVTINKVGTTSIIATQAATSTHTSATIMCDLIVT